MRYNSLCFLLFAFFLVACWQNKKVDGPIMAPWGEVASVDSVPEGVDFDLADIQFSGEMILLIMSGPEYYYDYHGRILGTQFLLVQQFAEHLGVRLRVEVCRDSMEMAQKLEAGEADLMASPTVGHVVCAASKPKLSDAFRLWYKPEVLSDVRRQEKLLLSEKSVRRRVFSPMLDRQGGVISRYDHLFQQYAQPIRWDWRLVAAQCYQESTFDPKATSFAGAKGLMQIMPTTADLLGLPRSDMYEPEPNIRAATQYLGQLEKKFSDIPDRHERTLFVLASYNGGIHHIRDAMSLCQRDGHNPHRWSDVSEYVQKLATPQYYNDPLVKHGYMRGSETADYVSKIIERWQQYRQVRTSRQGFTQQPRRATKQNKYQK